MLVLHAGCGHAPLPEFLKFGGKEVRLDIDETVEPDLCASIDDLGEIGPFNVVYSNHCLEHLHWDDAQKALREFHRVLEPGGFTFIRVPDLEGVPMTEEVMYEIPGLDSPITGLDMHFGYRPYTATNPFMFHKCGFVASTLRSCMEKAGFKLVRVERDYFNLIAVGAKL